jgi:hypothetical protein
MHYSRKVLLFLALPNIENIALTPNPIAAEVKSELELLAALIADCPTTIWLLD